MHELMSLLFSFFFRLSVPSYHPSYLPRYYGIPFAVLFPSLCKKEYPHSKYRCDFDNF